ncbi:replication-associated recombination protein A [Bianquea renquensis]|jgi:hypothetical protein|uniref:Replication-associated recombination protein A n=1 Tax=Bianquea renquensis TaxID=2763661 RepID=A0A926I2W4_9FIRM|nr:replication-associated recombination protein A [Bianquea renquensis]MBC8544506.1 replication-associated recombination protein A [Bianquea renquensis]
MDLFEYNRNAIHKNESPLAYRMRPETLEDFVGQEEIVGKGTLLYRAIKADKLGSVIFYGPPGTGKTTLARIIAGTTHARFQQMNAVTAGKKDIEAVIEQAKTDMGMTGTRTILFIDEIHRFNKAQQDALLPAVEEGVVILIGATTENPYFEVNNALLSRSRIFQLKPLTPDHIMQILERAVTDREKGMGYLNGALTEEAAEFLARTADGDARTALNALELGLLTTEPDAEGRIVIDLDVAQQCIQKKAYQYDKDGDAHYDLLSCFQKAIRGSDPDASLHYLARLLEGGDLKSICRRLLVIACEDIGLAYPQGITIVKSCVDSAVQVGLPEASIILSQAVVVLATAPKSNSSSSAIMKAVEDVRTKELGSLPAHLRDAHYKGAAKLGHGEGYRYPHDYPYHYVEQQYMPDALLGTVYYEPGENKNERAIRKYMEDVKKASGQ